MSEIEKLLETTAAGVCCDQPLVPHGYRYYPKARVWRRVQSCKMRGLPPIVGRSVIAAALEIEEATLQRWEVAARAAVDGQNESAADLLVIGPNGEFHSDPLNRWNFRFYPQSGVWRRARSHRNEVAREDVARRAGVTIELLQAWENAAIAASQSRNAA